MKNVEMTVEGTMLTIKVDLSKEFGPSSSGKTIIIASTEGNVTISNREEKVGLNVYERSRERGQKTGTFSFFAIVPKHCMHTLTLILAFLFTISCQAGMPRRPRRNLCRRRHRPTRKRSTCMGITRRRR